MITAIVMIKAEVDKIPEAAEAIAALSGIEEAYSVTGEWELIALAKVPVHEELADLIPGRLNKIPGVLHTETHIAFRTYSSRDLDAAFSLGLD